MLGLGESLFFYTLRGGVISVRRDYLNAQRLIRKP